MSIFICRLEGWVLGVVGFGRGSWKYRDQEEVRKMEGK